MRLFLAFFLGIIFNFHVLATIDKNRPVPTDDGLNNDSNPQQYFNDDDSHSQKDCIKLNAVLAPTVPLNLLGPAYYMRLCCKHLFEENYYL